MLNEAFAPARRYGSNAVAGSGQLTGHGANGVRVVAKVYCGNQGILEAESGPDSPHGCFKGVYDIAR